MKHLRALAASGFKAVHILPSFHFASVNENKSTWIIPPASRSIRPTARNSRPPSPPARRVPPTTGAMTPSTT